MIIWCLFDDYSFSIILLIWWLLTIYCDCLSLDYLRVFDNCLIIICSQLFVSIWWLFDPAAGRSASFISKSVRTAPWHIVKIAACPRGHISLRAAAEATHHHQPRSCRSCQYPPVERFAPLHTQRFSARGGGPSRHAISDGNRRPDSVSHLLCLNQTLAWMSLSALSWNNENKHNNRNNYNNQ